VQSGASILSRADPLPSLHQIQNLVKNLGIANYATVRRALEKTNGSEDRAVGLLLDNAVTPQSDMPSPSSGGDAAGGGGAAAPAPRGYYANVITGVVSVTRPPPDAAPSTDRHLLEATTTEEIAKSIEEIGSQYKPLADQILG
jgi:hypothetical protein